MWETKTVKQKISMVREREVYWQTSVTGTEIQMLNQNFKLKQSNVRMHYQTNTLFQMGKSDISDSDTEVSHLLKIYQI